MSNTQINENEVLNNINELLHKKQIIQQKYINDISNSKYKESMFSIDTEIGFSLQIQNLIETIRLSREPACSVEPAEIDPEVQLEEFQNETEKAKITKPSKTRKSRKSRKK